MKSFHMAIYHSPPGHQWGMELSTSSFPNTDPTAGYKPALVQYGIGSCQQSTLSLLLFIIWPIQFRVVLWDQGPVPGLEWGKWCAEGVKFKEALILRSYSADPALAGSWDLVAP